MCQNRRFIINPFYKYKKVLVDCGHCPSCLQKKANRNTRLIQLHSKLSDKVCIFSTLTYDFKSIPYVKVDDFDNINEEIKVYRDCKIVRPPFHLRRKYDRTYRIDGQFELSRVSKTDNHFAHHAGMYEYAGYTFSLSDIAVKESEFTVSLNQNNHVYNVCPAKPYFDRVGVLYYSDVQLFFNRLRQAYFRKFGKRAQIEYYACGEYGSNTQRPHFHILLWCKADDVKYFLASISKAWPYGSRRRCKKFTEIARDPSSYVCKYLNGHTFVSPFLQTWFPPKSSKSLYFGFTMHHYNLSKVLDFFRRGNYEEDFVLGNESSQVGKTSLCLPARVINRYFPRFTGDNNFDDVTLKWLIERPADFCACEGYTRFGRFTAADVRKKLNRGFIRWCTAGYPPDISLYADTYIRVWRNYRSYLLRRSIEINDERHIPLMYQFDNLAEVAGSRFRDKRYPLFRNVILDEVACNPNLHPHIKVYDDKLTTYFHQRLKVDGFNSDFYYAQDTNCGL